MAPHTFLDRIPTDSEWHTTAASAFSAVENFRGRIASIRANTKLSPEGHLDQMRKEATGPLLYLNDLRKQVAEERNSLARRRERFELPKHSDDDVIGALERQEIRTWLRSIENIGTRIKLAATDPEIATAVVHSPAELSGLNDDGRDRARQFLVDHLFGEEIAAVQTEAEVLDNVDQAISIATGELRNAYEPERVPFTAVNAA